MTPRLITRPQPGTNDPIKIGRRRFLLLSGSALAGYLGRRWVPRPAAAAGADRPAIWPPNPSDVLEWRYVAGRIDDGQQDFGFIVTLVDNRVPGFASQELLVQRQDLAGGDGFVSNTYAGLLAYDSNTATYTFQDGGGQELARWQWDEANQLYLLALDTAELALANVVLRPHGALIPEGGDGDIPVGSISGFSFQSDYHADWAAVEVDGSQRGAARIDMQGFRPSFPLPIQAPNHPLDQRTPAGGSDDYDHRWFAIAAELADGTPAWVSAWRIEDTGGPLWALTIARGRGSSWQIAHSLTEENTAAPLQVGELLWQDLPAAGPEAAGQQFGRQWRITAPNNALDVVLTVPPGQFIQTSFRSTLGTPSWMEEAVGVEASGTIMGSAITAVKLVVAESTAEFYLSLIPAVLKSF